MKHIRSLHEFEKQLQALKTLSLSQRKAILAELKHSMDGGEINETELKESLKKLKNERVLNDLDLKYIKELMEEKY